MTATIRTTLLYDVLVPIDVVLPSKIGHGMDTWPPTWRKGKAKATYPLLEGGALTSATLRECNGRLEWVTAQNLSLGA